MTTALDDSLGVSGLATLRRRSAQSSTLLFDLSPHPHLLRCFGTALPVLWRRFRFAAVPGFCVPRPAGNPFA